METINATLYIRPDGRTKDIEIKNILPEDADYINKNNIKVSLEKDGIGNIIVYFDYGRVDEEGEPDELIFVSVNKSAEDIFSEAVKKIKERVDKR